jgi:hypothetical protein
LKKYIKEGYDKRPDVNDDFIEIEVNPGTEDFSLFKEVIKQGIDSHLEGFVKSEFGYRNYQSIGRKAYFNFHKDEKEILVRRLNEIYEQTGDENAYGWIEDIEGYDNL